jgi:hypothetical protein
MRKVPLTEPQARVVVVVVAALASVWVWFSNDIPVWVQVIFETCLAVIALVGAWHRSRD